MDREVYVAIVLRVVDFLLHRLKIVPIVVAPLNILGIAHYVASRMFRVQLWYPVMVLKKCVMSGLIAPLQMEAPVQVDHSGVPVLRGPLVRIIVLYFCIERSTLHDVRRLQRK